ncbi:MAG TPA: alanine racemase, partial [Polyangiaceae bacterium]
MQGFRSTLASSKARVKAQVKSALRPLLQAAHSGQPPLEPALWELEDDARRGLLLEGVALRDLVTRFGSPLHVVHAARLRDNARRFQAVPPGATRGCEVFYSYKTNPIEGVLKLLHEQGIGAEVISPYELWLAKQLGVPPERTIYNGPAKSDDSIRDAIERRIQVINCNHREELPRVAQIARQLGVRARVALRVNTSGGWSGQFGTPIQGGQALAAYREALALPELSVVGVHAHRGGQVRNEHELSAFLQEVLGFVEELEQLLPAPLELLNFGGSLGLRTSEHLDDRARRRNELFHVDLPTPSVEQALTLERYLELVVGQVESHYRTRNQARPRIFLEPGRAMTGNTQLLLATVLTTKSAADTTCAVLDAGINLAESVKSEYHQLFAVTRHREPRTRVHTLVGPICSPADTLYPALRLPPLSEGDCLAIMDAGAYFVPFSTS